MWVFVEKQELCRGRTMLEVKAHRTAFRTEIYSPCLSTNQPAHLPAPPHNSCSIFPPVLPSLTSHSVNF